MPVLLPSPYSSTDMTLTSFMQVPQFLLVQNFLKDTIFSSKGQFKDQTIQGSSVWHPPAPSQGSEELLRPPPLDLLLGAGVRVAPASA